MKKKIYIETSVISYLAARPSRDIIASAWQQATQEWWEIRKSNFLLYVSSTVIKEVSQGAPDAARNRIMKIEGISVLKITDEAFELAEALVAEGAIPEIAMDDALHIAIAAIHKMDYILTWNFRHLDNAERKPLIRNICAKMGYECPEICTPQELMGEGK